MHRDDSKEELVTSFKVVNKRPTHVVIAFDEKQNKAHVIKTYEPTLAVFESDYKTRKKK